MLSMRLETPILGYRIVMVFSIIRLSYRSPSSERSSRIAISSRTSFSAAGGSKEEYRVSS